MRHLLAVLIAVGVVAPQACATPCDINNLQLIDVSCNPPHGEGPDGRVWVKLVCGEAKAPVPYDWQLARLSPDTTGDIFAWDADPLYAYVEGEAGSYQASAHTIMGVLDLNLSLPFAGCSGAVGDATVDVKGEEAVAGKQLNTRGVRGTQQGTHQEPARRAR